MVDQDSKDVNAMVLAAKYGRWSEVYAILDRKHYLVNCIPEDRSWAALHQAAWWGSERAVKKLLKYPSCDSEVKTRGGEFGPQCKPSEIANKKDFPGIKNVLDEFSKNERAKRFSGKIPTYVTAQDGVKMDKEGLPLLLLTIANYKQTFHPATIDVHTAFMGLMKEVFEYTWNDWEEAKEKISSALSAFCKAASDDLRKESTDEEKFHASIVRLYTRDYIYRTANKALRREGQEEYKATGDDLAVGPYDLMLDILLFYWNDLNPVSETTYRGLKMSDDDLKKYSKGTQFVWLSFVSSSLDRSAASNFGNTILFEISNNTPGAELWRPREISLFSAHPGEREALYPAGAEFEVTDSFKQGGKNVIKLKLKNPIWANFELHETDWLHTRNAL